MSCYHWLKQVLGTLLDRFFEHIKESGHMEHTHPATGDNQANPRDVQTEDPIQASLRIATETLNLLERDAQQSQALIRQLASHLQQQSDALANCRQTIRNLLHARAAPVATATCDGPTQLRIQCFGPFKIFRDEQALALRAGKATAILKFLALRAHQPVPREVLLEALWPQADPAAANNRLKVAVHHLRQTFVTKGCPSTCEGCVVFRDGCYLFNPNIRVSTDIQAFEQAWQAGVQLERAGRSIEAIPFYLQAETLYRGDLLEEDLYEEWTLLRREELKDSFLTVLDKLSRYWLQIGNLDDAVEGWKKILTRDPWREDVYRRIMACSAYRGQRGLALRWYEMCTQALQSQLNIDPEPETIALQQRILAGEDVSGWMGV